MAAARPGPAVGRTGQPDALQPLDLKLLSIEELMEIDVTTATRRPERLGSVAAAVSVVTGEELRRSGATTLAEALRLAPGLQVAQANNRTWAISARGFNITTANKLEVMIDGRSVYSPLLSGVFWDVQDTLLADIDRIEVIRGPGASVWGANAVNGVINVITRPARESQGARLVLASGNQEAAFVETRYGGRAGTTGHYRAWGKFNYHGAQTLAGGLDAQDLFRKGQGGFRVDWGAAPDSAFTVQGDLYRARLGQFEAADTATEGGHLLARLERRRGPGRELRAQLSYDRAHRHIPTLFEETQDTFQAGLEQRLEHGRHALIAGGDYRRSRSNTLPTPGLFFDPQDRTTDLVRFFADDELELLPRRLFVSIGSSLEHNAYTGFEFQPGSRVRLMLPQEQVLWGAVSRAVRMPTRLENDARFLNPDGSLLLVGNRNFRSEELLAYEAGYRLRPARWVAVDLAVFHNRYDHIRSQELPDPAGPIVLGNTLEAVSSGLELTARLEPDPRVRFQATYMRLDLEIRRAPGSRDILGGVSEGNDPDHQFMVRGSADLPGSLELDGGLRAVGALPNPPVPGYTEADVRLGWRAVPGLELSLVGRNLLQDRHPEFGAPGPQRVEIARSVSLRLAWEF